MKVTKLGGSKTGINKPASHAPISNPYGDTKVMTVKLTGKSKKKMAKKSKKC